MGRRLFNKVIPNWTASKEELRHRQTIILGLLITAIPLVIFPVSQYATRGETAPAGPAMLITLVYFIFVPALAFQQRTEVLYDGTQIALRFLVSGFLIFTAAYWLTPAETLYNSTPQLFAFMGVCTALYATVVLGVIWAIQFARKGTSGIDTEFQ